MLTAGVWQDFRTSKHLPGFVQNGKLTGKVKDSEGLFACTAEGRVRLSIHDNFALLRVALTAAQKAGEYFESRLFQAKDVKVKSSLSDLVTDVDPACEKMIKDTILSAFPTHQILGEESVAPGAEASAKAVDGMAESSNLWIVDPLDGTTNFVYNMPLSTVSIGYAENGRLVVGVIFDPYRSEVFFALAGQGAHLARKEEAAAWALSPSPQLPGTRIQCSNEEKLENAVVASGFPTRGEARAKTTEAGLLLANRVKNMRALGSAALHLAYVSCARLDAFWEYDLNAWDLAAGALLVAEAGGVAMDIEGQPFTLRTRDIVVAGCGNLANELAKAVRVD